MKHRAYRALAAVCIFALTFAGTATAEPELVASSFPSLGLSWGDNPYKASVDLAELGMPLITLSNPSREAFAVVRLVAWSAETGTSRWTMVQLEPRGSSTLSLEGDQNFSHLSLVSADKFGAEVVSAANDQRRDIAVAQAGTPELGGFAQKFLNITCSGTWTLTCASGGCSGLGPFPRSGRVEDGDQVYWNLNDPTGPWTTENYQGLTATWGGIVNGCPTTVTNSLGHTYDVDITSGGGGGCASPCVPEIELP
ncbi:MAG: hypothetical protein AAF560_08170 [Acidobacteriota bacterium]